MYHFFTFWEWHFIWFQFLACLENWKLRNIKGTCTLRNCTFSETMGRKYRIGAKNDRWNNCTKRSAHLFSDCLIVKGSKLESHRDKENLLARAIKSSSVDRTSNKLGKRDTNSENFSKRCKVSKNFKVSEQPVRIGTFVRGSTQISTLKLIHHTRLHKCTVFVKYSLKLHTV